jgi:hypothetical protein
VTDQPPPATPPFAPPKKNLETLNQPWCISFFDLPKLDAYQQRRRRRRSMQKHDTGSVQLQITKLF